MTQFDKKDKDIKKSDNGNNTDFDFLKEQYKVHSGKIVLCEERQGQMLDEATNDKIWNGNIFKINDGVLMPSEKENIDHYEFNLFNNLMCFSPDLDSMIENIKNFIVKTTVLKKKWLVSINTSNELSILGMGCNVEKIKQCVKKVIDFINSDEFPKQENKLLVKISTKFENLEDLNGNFLYTNNDVFYSVILFKQDIKNFTNKFGSMVCLFNKDYILKIFNKSNGRETSFGKVLQELNDLYFDNSDNRINLWGSGTTTYFSRLFKAKQFKYMISDKF